MHIEDELGKLLNEVKKEDQKRDYHIREGIVDIALGIHGLEVEGRISEYRLDQLKRGLATLRKNVEGGTSIVTFMDVKE